MKKISIIIICFTCALTVMAQHPNHRKFSPEKFQQEMQQYIVNEASLTQQESAKFLPLFTEMHQKQRAIYDRQRKLCKQQETDEAACREIVKENDKLDLELKKLQQTYHEKFLNVLPASKVLKVIRAESRFHREQLKKWKREK